MLIALITISPLAFMSFVVATTIPQILPGLDHEQGPRLYRHLASSINGLTVFWTLLLASYLVHLFMSQQVDRNARISWVVAFVVLGPVAELAYWRRYIWPRKSACDLQV